MAVFPQGHVLSLYSELSSSQKMIMVAGGRRNLKKKKKWKGTHVLEDGPRADTVEKQGFIQLQLVGRKHQSSNSTTIIVKPIYDSQLRLKTLTPYTTTIK